MEGKMEVEIIKANPVIEKQGLAPLGTVSKDEK